MAITSDIVKKLREKTGAGMMDCKRALEESGGDTEKAIEFLRKKGAATAEKRADKRIAEGAIVTRVANQNKLGVIVEVNCETDFVARGTDFVDFSHAVAQAIEMHKPATLDPVGSLATSTGKTVGELLNELLAKVSERIEVRRFSVVQTSDGIIGGYTHMGNKIGVLVEVTGLAEGQDGATLSRDIAMQIAAMNPQYVRREDVPKETVEREMEIYRTQARNEGKPEQMLGRIADGKLGKFCQEICLIEQSFIKDPGKTIRDILGSSGAVRSFHRFHLGENI